LRIDGLRLNLGFEKAIAPCLSREKKRILQEIRMISDAARAVWKPAQKMPAAKVELRIWCQKECEFGEILMDEVPNSVESPDENP